jgi:hypothetical protein
MPTQEDLNELYKLACRWKVARELWLMDWMETDEIRERDIDEATQELVDLLATIEKKEKGEDGSRKENLHV